MMTRREIVIAALRHRETPVTPYHADFTLQEYERMVKFTGDKNFYEKYGGYLHYMQYWGYPTEREDRKEHFTDDFGVTWNRSGADKDIGVVDEPSIPEPDISLYRTPFLNEARIRKECEELLAAKEDKFCFAGIGFSMFERLWSYVGMENALIYMLTDKEFVHELLDRICDFNLKVIDIFNDYPFDGIYFGDDWGQQKGMIMGAPLWREFIKPRMAKKSNDLPNSSNPNTMPMNISGSISRMTVGLRYVLNNSSRVVNIRKKVSGRFFAKASFDST